jgi:hypothetical protein
LGQISALGKSIMDREHYKEILSSLQQTLNDLNIPVMLLPISDSPLDQPLNIDPGSDLWQHALNVYFVQILSEKSAVLDFRPQSFNSVQSQSNGISMMGWNPSSICIVWEDEFILPLRDMYRGFYYEDTKLFRKSLEKLGLSSAEQILKTHFGKNQSSHRFKLQDFLSTFNQVFLAAKKSKSRIHPQFLPFGLSLAALYQSLEATNRDFDVKSSFIHFEARVKS